METFKKIIQEASRKRQASNQSPSKVRYHINGKEIKWDKLQIEKFWKGEFLKSIAEIEPRFVVDERNKGILSALYDYVWHKSSVLDSSKGLLLWGEIGVGKSLLIRGIQNYMAKTNRYRFGCGNRSFGFELISAVEISLLYAEKGMEGICQFTNRECMRNLAIDEIGKEPDDSKYYGTGINVIQTILQLRYDARHEFITHATTNLNPNTDFGDKYGDYIADRVKEMFNVIEVKGDSRR